ncbi:signal peptidase I [Pandoraea cepalis]|uniref:Signal peptidase I n=2 Tax=Pandoraea cepalis TaxID=2508294 RepID=A0AAW7MGL4_9BURK|nr:signal peptidase I [Pandoraea cepalis]MDN4581326.1 signal peptidase I [Pandoraea cepalis]
MPNERRKFFTFLAAMLLLVACFWGKPIVSFGFDPQEERCLPDLHLALLVHHTPSTVKNGDLLFWTPRGSLAGFKEKFILKQVAGVPGDRVTIRGEDVQINGKTVVHGFPLAHTYRRDAREFERDEIIPHDKYFLIGVHPMSNDSRYWGYLDSKEVVGFAYKLF